MFFEESRDHTLTVKSRFRVWALTRWHGYRVRNVSRRPTGLLIGMIRYETRWTLEPASKGQPRRDTRRCA
jgi:hypothetical protein